MIPYLGLITYTPNDTSIFWGRDTEIKNSINNILDNVSTMFFGPSGCGKSSLIQAGIIPVIKTYQYHSIYITPRTSFTNDTTLNLWPIINEQINSIVKEYNLKTIAKYEGIIWTEKTPLWEKLYFFDYIDDFGFANYFNVIIDQFEEIFQQDYNIKQIESIFEEYELLCGYFRDDHLLREINNNDLFDYNSFLKHKNDITPIPHRFVVSLRQDFLFEMESYSNQFPVLCGNRICIKHLNEEQAFAIITTSKKDNGDNWFSNDDAIKIIEDISGRKDFQIDGVPEIEVDAMMLSLFLKETCIKINVNSNYNISDEGNDAMSLIKTYYLMHMDYHGIELLEKELVSADGKYRKSIPFSEAKDIVPKEKLEEFVEFGILNIFINHAIEWVELRHDRLCPCAAYHSTLESIKQHNHKLFSPFSFLLPQGRLQFSNRIDIDESDIYQSYSKWLSQLFKKGYIENINIELLGLLRNSQRAHSCTLKINLNDIQGIKCYTDDGIGEMTVKLVKGKLYEIAFFRNNKPHSLYFGAHKIVFYYDNLGRLILSDFFDDNNIRIFMEDGFTSILYSYFNEKAVPYKTFYLKIPTGVNIVDIANPKKDDFFDTLLQYKTWHNNGNYGFESCYDERDIEVSRIFLNKDGVEDVIQPGFSEIRYEINKGGALTSFEYYRFGEKYEYKNIHKTTYEYDPSGEHLVRELYFDNNNQPVSTDTGYYGLSCEFDKSVIKITHLNEKGEPGLNSEGIAFQKIIIDSNNQVECIINMDAQGKPHFSNDLSFAVQYMHNYPNSQIQYLIQLDEQLQIMKFFDRKYYTNKYLETEYDDAFNIERRTVIERKDYIIKCTNVNKFGIIVDDDSFEKIGPYTHVLKTLEGRMACEQDERGNVIKSFSCDENNNQIADEDGFWERRSEYLHDKVIKHMYYSKENVPYEIEPGVYGYGYEYDSKFSLTKTYELDYYGNRNHKCVKYHLDFNIEENYSFFDESSIPIKKTTKNGKHSVRTTNVDDGIFEVINYNVNDQPCNCSEGWSILIYNFVEGTRIYLNSEREPVNGPEGWHKYIEASYTDKKGRIILPIKHHLYLNTDGQWVENTEGDAALIIRKFPSIVKWIISLYRKEYRQLMRGGTLYLEEYYDAQHNPFRSYLIKQDKKNSKEITYPIKKTSTILMGKGVSPKTKYSIDISAGSYKLYGINPYDVKGMLMCIYVEQGSYSDQDDEYSKNMWCKDGDLILRLGDWSVFDYIDSVDVRYKKKTSPKDMVDDFEMILNKNQSNNELSNLYFARLSDGNQWNIYSVRFRFKEDCACIGKMVDKKISKDAYKEVFSCYSEYIEQSQNLEKNIDGDGVIRRVKQLLNQ